MNNHSLPKRKPLHLKDFDYSNSANVFFITICTANKKPYFMLPEVVRIVTDEIRFRSSEVSKEIRLYCYCIMPDHIHMFFSLSDNYKKSLQNWVATFKRYTSRSANILFGITPLWQKNFYDHVIRKDESLIKIAGYIVHNPVRKGMVSEWVKYPYSYLNKLFLV